MWWPVYGYSRLTFLPREQTKGTRGGNLQQSKTEHKQSSGPRRTLREYPIPKVHTSFILGKEDPTISKPSTWLAGPISLDAKGLPEEIRERLRSFLQECPASKVVVQNVAAEEDLGQEEDMASEEGEEALLEGEEDLEDLSDEDLEELEEDSEEDIPNGIDGSAKDREN